MRTLAILLALSLGIVTAVRNMQDIGPLPTVAAADTTPCVGAVHAQLMAAQERKTPDGEWCQRPQPDMSKKAHACKCHEHDCSDPDPNHVSAHVDAECLNYCNVSGCRCGVHDCP